MRKTAAILFVYFLGVFVLSAQSVKVKSPNGGEQWALNSSQAITWTFANAGSVKVNIILRNSNSKVGIIKSHVPLSAGSFTWTSVGTLEDGTPVGPGINYTVRIRDVGDTFDDESDAAFSISGAPAPLVFKKIPPLDRPPVNLFPPQLRITHLSIDPGTAIVSFKAKNFGGPMTKDAKVVLSTDGYQLACQAFEFNWAKSKESVSFEARLLTVNGLAGFCACKLIGAGDVCLNADIQSPEIQGVNVPGIHAYTCYPAHYDLAVSGLKWGPSGAISFAVGNNGQCPSSAWFYRLYRMGQLVETSGLKGSIAPGLWNSTTAAYRMPANVGGSCTFKVEVVSQLPATETTTANNIMEVRTTPNAGDYQIVISDIQFSGVADPARDNPPSVDEYYELVYTLTNTSGKDYPECIARVQTSIDNGPVVERKFWVSFGPNEKVVLSKSNGFPTGPVLPYGTHTVAVSVNICPTFMKKTMMRRPQG